MSSCIIVDRQKDKSYNNRRTLTIKYIMMTSTSSRGQVKESPIDERYRLLLLNQYLKNLKEVPVTVGSSKWVFCCPFCSSLGRTEAKRGMNAKEHCSGMPYRTPGSSSASVRAVLNALVVERPWRSS